MTAAGNERSFLLHPEAVEEHDGEGVKRTPLRDTYALRCAGERRRRRKVLITRRHPPVFFYFLFLRRMNTLASRRVERGANTVLLAGLPHARRGDVCLARRSAREEGREGVISRNHHARTAPRRTAPHRAAPPGCDSP